MSVHPQLSFSSGEIDPILFDNVTLEKFKKGLATARNVIIGKTGSIMSRFPRQFVANAKNQQEPIVIYCPRNSRHLLEFGIGYVRVYSFGLDDFGVISSSFQVEIVTDYTEGDLQNLHFTTSKDYVYIFCSGRKVKKLFLANGSSAFVAEADIFAIPDPLYSGSCTPTASTGYTVEYVATIVLNGEESIAYPPVDFPGAAMSAAKPIAAGQSNELKVAWIEANVDMTEFTEVKWYSRPLNGGAYGYLGSTTWTEVVGLARVATYIDNGELPDYTNGIPDLITKYGLAGAEVIDLKPATGTVYQQRLLIANLTNDNEAILVSRPGFQNNFYRDFPYSADSSLQFKSGTSGKANVLRVIEENGLVVFTTVGVFTSSGILGINNIALERRGSWVINPDIPPLLVPGGLFFVDDSNTIRQLVFSQEIVAYESVEQTIFSNHLFENRTIESWCYQKGVAPLIIVTFSDGTFASFTYNFEHQMRAWTRHDSAYDVDQVTGTDERDISVFVVNNNGNRSIEISLPRKIPALTISLNPESDKSAPICFMDSIKSKFTLLNDLFSTGENFIITPVTLGEWDGNLNLTTNIGTDFTVYGVGAIFRFFHPIDKTVVDLKILNLTDPLAPVVKPSDVFPEDYTASARLYRTWTVIDGLSHLEGEAVGIVVDGGVVASPLNNKDFHTGYIVTGGQITLPEQFRGAIIHVGMPICGDIKTLNVSTVEQSPTLIESLNINKLYIRVFKSRGLYVSNQYPEELINEVDGTSVRGMDDLDEAIIPPGGELLGNKPLPKMSKRCEKMIPGGWDSNGQIAIRGNDPLHFEILSIIADVEILKRSDR